MSRLSLLLVSVGLLLAPAAVAKDVQTAEAGGVRCSASYSWPDTLNHGYFPVPVELTNTTDQRIDVAVLATPNWGQEDRITKTVSIDAGERVEFELLLRARTGAVNRYVVSFEAGDEETGIGGRGPQEYSRGSEGTVMYFSPRRIGEDSTDTWESEWETRSSRHSELTIGAALFEEMSTSWEAYSSLDSVVLDLRDGLPGREQLEAVVAWARAGGRLILADPSPATRLADVPSIACWLEERFLVAPDTSPGPSDSGLAAYHAGTGFLVLASPAQGGRNPMDVDRAGSSNLAFRAHELDLAPVWFPAAEDSRSDRALKTLTGFGNLPLRGLMVLLVLFALVMGPVNFLWVRRMKKPMMLLVTVPGIAIVTSLGLIAYGIFSNGLDIKAVTRSWSVLDQRDSNATTAEVRRLFAGSSPGVGLRPERGTAVFPEARFWRGSHSGSHLFTQDLTGGRLLAGDYLQIRQPMGQLILSDRTARVRLEARYVGEEIEVSNALGTQVTELLLRTPDGEYHGLPGSLEPGASARLVPVTSPSQRMAWSDDLTWIWGGDRTRLAPGSYIARLAGAALQDDCGVEVNEIEGQHVVMGILEADPEAWR